MTPMKWAAAAALGCALCLATANANAAIIIRNATGFDADDFHIDFSGPADKLKLTTGNFNPGVTYPAPSPKQNQIDFTGGSGVKNGNSMTLNGLTFGKLGKGLQVTGWFFTSKGKPLTGEPLISTGNNQFTDLPTLVAKGITVVAVPEPGAWTLMILGAGATGAMLRRRRARAA